MATKKKVQQKKVKCGWCGKFADLSPAGNAKWHANGATMCVGTGQPKSAHNFLCRSNAEANGSPSLPKSDRR